MSESEVDKQIGFDFDDEADVLYISLERPQNATDTDMLDNGVFVRLRGKKVVGMTITNFSHKFKVCLNQDVMIL